jgi:hypothetical protein
MTAKTYSPEAMALADVILKASGSNLKNYTMQSSLDAILGAAQAAIDAARAQIMVAMKELLLDAPYPNWAFYPPEKVPVEESENARKLYIVSLNNAREAYRKAGGA